VRKGIILLCVLALAACQNYTLVKKEQTSIDGISLMPVGGWNTVPDIQTFNGVPTWTADGTYLNAILFFPKIGDGSPLIKPRAEEKYPNYSSSMLPNEVMEMTKSTFAKMFATTITDEGELAPYKTASGMAYQFSFNFADQDGLTRKILATAQVKDKQLYMVVYYAANMHFYDKDLPNVQQMMQSMTVM
jgi:hypothetical protein